MEDLWSTRPSSVQEVVLEKFRSLQGEENQEKDPIWTNMGHKNLKILYNNLGDYVNTDDIIHEQIFRCSETRVLDLGTAKGDLLIHVKERWGIPWERLYGISAYDHRIAIGSHKAIPDSSYHVINIDELYRYSKELGKFGFIWSACTFYHLVDPVGILPVVFDLLEIGGVAMLLHIPLHGSIHKQAESVSRKDVGLEAKYLQAFLQKKGFNAMISETFDKPGNELYTNVEARINSDAGFCMLGIVKEKDSPEKLVLPYRFSGSVNFLAGNVTSYAWAELVRTEEVALTDELVQPVDFFENLGVPIQRLKANDKRKEFTKCLLS